MNSKITDKNEIAMLMKKKDVIDTGYDETDFGKFYWLDKPNLASRARIERDAGAVIKYWHDIFEIKGLKRGSIIDVGAGAGSIVKDLKDAGFDAHGCEFSSSGREIAKARFDIDLSECDLRQRLPYVDNEFDWSICLGVLSMIPKCDMANAISEILRITKYGTLILVLTIASDVLKLASDKFVSSDRGLLLNPHHLTAMSSMEYWGIIVNTLGGYDWTSIRPPQGQRYGMGISRHEFCGLFSKSRAL